MALFRFVRFSCSLCAKPPVVIYTRYSVRPPSVMASKLFSSHNITQNLLLNSASSVKVVQDGSSVPKVVKTTKQQPLLLLLEYMNAKDKHVNKFVDFYIGFGFDVLRIHLKPWQLLWPVKGSQIVAKDIADFLLKNEDYTSLVIHAFSVGGYLWGEVLVHMESDNKYQAVADRVQGQIFDSVVDIDQIPVGFPNAVFPNNPLLKSTFEKYIRYHMKTFYNESTRHYERSRHAFTAGLVRAPVLALFSAKDPLSTPDSNELARKQWEQNNVECRTKCFADSKHVMHFQKYKEEYLAEVDELLVKSNVLQPMRFKAKL